MTTTAESTEFFRTKLLLLEDGSMVYESSNGKVLLRPVDLRERMELVNRRLLGFGDVAYSPELQIVRPAWSFPAGSRSLRVMAVQYESASKPLDDAATATGSNRLDEEAKVMLF